MLRKVQNLRARRAHYCVKVKKSQQIQFRWINYVRKVKKLAQVSGRSHLKLVAVGSETPWFVEGTGALLVASASDPS